MRTARRQHKARGSIYVIVMTTTLVVLVLSMGGIAAQRTLAAARAAARDELQARRLAVSAVELAIQQAQNTLRWRSSEASPVFTDLAFGEGYISASVSDPVDANVSNNITDPIMISAVGRVGHARQKVSVRASVNPSYLSSLSGVMHAGGNISINTAWVRSASPIGANGNVTATGSTVRCDVYAGGTISGATFAGTNSSSQAARTMPSTDVINQYRAMATPITLGSIGQTRLRRVVLSGNSNPYGTVNTSGIYSIDCGGGAFEIQDSRIIGTLVITNCTTVTVSSAVNMEPWDPGFPVILTTGTLIFSTYSTDLIEATHRNFNPSGDPYEGVSDADTLDRYPCTITGLVYSTGEIRFTQRATIIGAVIAGGNINIQSGAVVHLWRSVNNAPPGFVTRAFELDSTTWAKGVD
jgi:hypothetical protein